MGIALDIAGALLIISSIIVGFIIILNPGETVRGIVILLSGVLSGLFFLGLGDIVKSLRKLTKSQDD